MDGVSLRRASACPPEVSRDLEGSRAGMKDEAPDYWQPPSIVFTKKFVFGIKINEAIALYEFLWYRFLEI